MRNFPSLDHITDVGAAGGEGSDSTQRIRRAYQRLGIEGNIITAGQSPLHVAFTGITTLSKQAEENADRALDMLGLPRFKKPPIALNCAPRNQAKPQKNGKEDHIYRLKKDGDEQASYLIYGPQVLRYALSFLGRERVRLEKVLSINDHQGDSIISDTSRGSQFRSAEHLPIAHFLENLERLDEFATKEEFEPEEVREIIPEEGVLIAPPDEFQNGRIILRRELAQRAMETGRLRLRKILDGVIEIEESLTHVKPGRISAWASSNHFPNPDIVIFNLGTRWEVGQNKTTDPAVIHLSNELSSRVGEEIEIDLD